jgi:hypothetical protein
MIALEPTQQSGPEIETDMLVVIYDQLCTGRRVSDARAGIGLIALGMNPLVPIVKGRCAGLNLNNVRPRILSWGLIEMSVNN